MPAFVRLFLCPKKKEVLFLMLNESYMRRAIELAKNGTGYVSPNPLVGAVIVKDGEVIGEGYHARCGDLHAERNALKNCKKDPAGADLYVTLEPCCHQGRTPPCTEAILEAKIKRVIIGSRDPNPKVAGKGAAILREHGVEVFEDFLKEECDGLNDIFFHYITTKTPYVAIKYAMTLDGKIAAVTGESKWITDVPAREHVHQLRHRYRGILVGIGTVLKDDPMLNCRLCEGRDPIRIICDSHLRIPMDSQIVKTAKHVPTIIACTDGEAEKRKALAEAGAELLVLPAEDGHVSLKHLMIRLGEKEIDSILAEGGGMIHYSLLKEGLAQRV